MTQKTYDYVVIGGGSAGCVVAARLIEAGASVCLLEAGGGDRHPLISTPAAYGRLLGQPPFWAPKAVWGYKTVPQTNLNNRVLNYTQAKVLGGGSSINAMIYTRGHRQDYDDWEAAGAVGWGYDAVLPYFKKSERAAFLDPRYHGREGALEVTHNTRTMPISQSFVAAGQEVGLPLNFDFNGENQEGVGFHTTTRSKNRRNNTVRAFLRRHMNSDRLTTILGAQVRRLVTRGGRVSHVEFQRGGRREVETVAASEEFILSSGTIGSPKLLMLSGIGPAAQLHSLGISVVEDHPEVGENLQDHMDAYVVYHCTGPYGYHGGKRFFTEAKWLLEYIATRGGPLASNFVESGAFIRVNPQSAHPDTQLHLLPAYVIDSGRDAIKGYGVSLYTTLLRPRSRGSIKLASADPTAHPLIDPNFLGDPYELKMAVGAIEKAREIMSASAFKGQVGAELLPGAELRTRQDIEEHVRRFAKTDYHPVGTCRMGSDARAVVTPELKLNGFDNIRVIDASVMPNLIGGNTNAPTIMIAEKGAAAILAGP